MSHHFMLSNTGRWLKTKLYLQMVYKNNEPMFLSTFLYTRACAVNLLHAAMLLSHHFLSWTRRNPCQSASTYRGIRFVFDKINLASTAVFQLSDYLFITRCSLERRY